MLCARCAILHVPWCAVCASMRRLRSMCSMGPPTCNTSCEQGLQRQNLIATRSLNNLNGKRMLYTRYVPGTRYHTWVGLVYTTLAADRDFLIQCSCRLFLMEGDFLVQFFWLGYFLSVGRIMLARVCFCFSRQRSTKRKNGRTSKRANEYPLCWPI